MPKKKLDKETRDLLSEQEKVKKLSEHEGWAFVRSLFLNKAAQFLNLADIANPDPTKIVQIIGSRQLAANALLEILNEVQGTAQQFDANSQLTQEINESYILRIPSGTIDLNS